MNKKKVAEKAFADFPGELVPDGNWEALYEKNSVDFAPCGVDGDGRLIWAVDDGTVVAYDLETADPEKNKWGTWKLNADREIISHGSYPDEYMLDRDTSDWLWVHPQWRYLTAEAKEFEYDPVSCEDCGELVVVTRQQGAKSHDERVKFECACSVGSVAATKPDSWTGGEFL